jgi:hypothetical protein
MNGGNPGFDDACQQLAMQQLPAESFSDGNTELKLTLQPHL